MSRNETGLDMSPDWILSVNVLSSYRPIRTGLKEVWVIRRDDLSVMVVEQLALSALRLNRYLVDVLLS